jgi:tetratricopeptide (TPR) repeat protein
VTAAPEVAPEVVPAPEVAPEATPEVAPAPAAVEPEAAPVAPEAAPAAPEAAPEVTPVEPAPELAPELAPEVAPETVDVAAVLPAPAPETAASYPPPAPTDALEPAPPKKSRKKLFIILGIVLLVVILAVGGVLGFSFWRSSVYDQGVEALAVDDYQQAYDNFAKLGGYKDAQDLMELARLGLDYEAAQALLDAEDYEGAKQAFEALSGFEDAADKALFCQQNIDYLAAIADFDKGDFERALEVFTELADAKFEDTAQWRDKSNYAIANKKYEAGDLYGAYGLFKNLGSFEDSAERAQQCTTAFPATGELYHNGDFVSSVSALVLNGSNTSYPSYYKLYTGSTLVATFFLNAGGSCTIELPPGDYQVREAIGDVWFGEEVMFGDEGDYAIMTFDDGIDYFTLEYNIEMTITLSVIGELSGDAVGSDPTTREGF